MHVLSWFDNRTLIACDFIVSLAFALVFFGMKRSYPSLRGINTIAISFLLGVPATGLLASRGSMPYFASVTIANCFLFGSFVFLYRGILRFIGSRRSAFLPIVASVIALCVLFYFSEIQENIVPRIVAISLTIGIVRGLIAMELFRKSPTFTSPTSMRMFAAVMALFAAVSVNCGIITVLHGAPSHLLESNEVGTATLLLGVVSILCIGLFMLVLASGELIARSRDESQKDPLSGVFNRRGIEVKLAAELKHLQRGRHKLSVALIDVDYFKSINDIQGHAAGDAALREVAETISTHLRGRDHLGRYGGDEFLLVLPGTPCNIALGVTDRLNQAVSDRTGSSGCLMPLTLSIGLTEATAEDNAVTLIARADKALYQAKADGRNCRRVVVASDETAMDEHAQPPVGIGDVVMPAVRSTLLH
ncbi:MAG TPA: GGDEF domain-containing protein [Acidobacteriaceae bacterium]|nr:GGDEF domain-containing protein [Acidobacteriaceae bacterium]